MTSTVTGTLYRGLAKPVLFRLDPEVVHECAARLGERLENHPALVRWFIGGATSEQEKTVLGVRFNNPVGLAAGFDYNGHLAQVMRHVGFGFNTVGTVTALASPGNPSPQLGRLRRSQSLLVNKGFKSDGANAVAARLDQKNLAGRTIGISIGSTNLPTIARLEDAIADYCASFSLFQTRLYVSYFELNISCPNTALAESFVQPSHFENLLAALDECKVRQPIFVKMPNEIQADASDALVRIALRHGVRGFIFSNLVKNRSNPAFNAREIAALDSRRGNFSGRPAAAGSLALVAHARQTFGNDIAIIACGGIFSSGDVTARFAAGADLVQLITGMIFEGPQLIGELVRGCKIASTQK